MKQFVVLLMALLTIGGFATAQNKKDYKEMKSLVAYFSATGNTKKAAQMVAQVSGGELFEIVPQQPYSEADLDWTNKDSRSSVEMNNKSSRPTIASKVENIEQYEVIYVGFPIWWGIAPTIINTFLEQYNLEGKTIVPFFTSGSSGAGRTIDYLQPSAPKALFKEPHLLSYVNEQAVREWLARIF
ncbi:MAG: flavodoxin [Bacteroidales bacterium]|nr:flavodoxin [Bacteroidales bacterium]